MNAYGFSNPLSKNSPFRDKALNTVNFKYGNRQIMRTKYLKNKKVASGQNMPTHLRSLYSIYLRSVMRFTTESIKSNSIINLNKRGRLDLNPNAWHLDHKFSIYEGFKHSVPAYIIGSIYNLELIPARKNCGKGKKCSISLEQLFTSWFNSTRSQ